MDFTSFLSHCWEFYLRSLPFSPESLSSPRSLVISRGSLHLPPPWGCIFPLILLAPMSSFLSPHLHIWSCFPFPLTCPSPTQIPSFPLPPVIIFFSLSSGIEASSLGPFCLLTFLSSVDCILGILANIHLLVNRYHASLFGSEFPHTAWYLLVPSIRLQNSWCPFSIWKCNSVPGEPYS